MDANKIGYRLTQSANGDPHVRTEPDGREHDTETLNCWCNPSITVLCGECGASNAGCWACEQGLKTITRAEAEFEAGPFIVVHNG